MITRVSFTPRRPGTSVEQLQREWGGEHGAIAAQLPGLRGYVQNHAVQGLARPLPYPGFDVCAELEFDDAAAMEAAVASPHYAQRIAPARPATIDMPRTRSLLAERRTLRAGEPGEADVKLMTFLRAGSDRERFLELLAGPWAEALAELAPRRHDLLLADPAGAPPFDAIDVLWLEDAERAEAAAHGEAAAAARLALGTDAAASERLIARPIIFASAPQPAPQRAAERSQ